MALSRHSRRIMLENFVSYRPPAPCRTNLQLVVDSQEDKWSFLRTVSRHVSNTMCRPDPDQFLVRLSARDMSLDASDLNVSSFSRALSSFHKTKQKVRDLLTRSHSSPLIAMISSVNHSY